MPLLPLFISFFHAVMGSSEYPLLNLYVEGSVRADGDSFKGGIRKKNDLNDFHFGPGGGSGGTILLFLLTLSLSESGIISSAGGNGSQQGGGGGGGGRIHFHWSDVPTGDTYWPVATVNGSIHTGLVRITADICKFCHMGIPNPKLLYFMIFFKQLYLLTPLTNFVLPHLR